MKLSTITIMLFLCFVSTIFAEDHTIDSGFVGALTLQDSDTLLMTGGGINSLTLADNDTVATIQGTSALAEGTGGIWYILIAGHLNVSGGEIHKLDFDDDGTATLSGGLIELITGTQLASPDPHIEIICRDWSWDEPTNILTGTWADYTTFDIQLDDWPPYDPAIENIKFTIVPEPFSLLLLGAGGATLITRRRH